MIMSAHAAFQIACLVSMHVPSAMNRTRTSLEAHARAHSIDHHKRLAYLAILDIVRRCHLPHRACE